MLLLLPRVHNFTCLTLFFPLLVRCFCSSNFVFINEIHAYFSTLLARVNSFASKLVGKHYNWVEVSLCAPKRPLHTPILYAVRTSGFSAEVACISNFPFCSIVHTMRCRRKVLHTFRRNNGAKMQVMMR